MMEYRDAKTGALVRTLVSGAGYNELTYQTHPRWTPDMRYLGVTSDRSGGVPLPHARSMASGEIRCLADAAADWTLARKSSRLFYRSGDAIGAVQVDSLFEGEPVREELRVYEGLAELKPFSLTLDASEECLYAGVILAEGERWGLARIDLSKGAWDPFLEVNFRVGHVQANPEKSGVVMFCHETGGDAAQRIWVAETGRSGLAPFYRETYEEWVTHEVWWGGDRAIFTIWPYDEEHRNKPHGVVSADLATGTPQVHSQFPAWHAHGSPDGKWAVADDMDRNIWLISVETRERRLLTQGHLGEGFKTHCHPSFTPDGKGVVLNSSRDGTHGIVLAEIPEFGQLPMPEDVE